MIQKGGFSMKLWKRMTLLAVLCMVLSLLAACGGDTGNASQDDQGDNDKTTVEQQKEDDKQEETEEIQAPDEEYVLISITSSKGGDYYFYDEQGRIAKVEKYYDGKLESNVLYSYEEGADGTVICNAPEYYANGADDRGRLYYATYEFIYDSQGLLLKETVYSGGEKRNYEYSTEYEYDAQGRLIKQWGYKDGRDSEPELVDMYEYIYDDQGRLDRKNVYIKNTTEMSYYWDYGYNEKGENDYYVQLKPDGTRYGYSYEEGTPAPEGPTHVWEYMYHDNGTVRLAEQKHIELGNPICTEKYDEYGMLISVRDDKTGDTNTYEYAPLSQAPRAE